MRGSSSPTCSAWSWSVFDDTGIASARAKADKLNARALAVLLWKGEIDPVWMPDERCRVLRRRLARREQLVHGRSRAKNEIQAVLQRRLIERPGFADLFGVTGRRWLAEVELPLELRDASRRRLDSLLSLIDDFDREITISREIDQQAKVDERVTLLCQIRGVGRYTAMLIIAEIGDIRRFPTARHLCAWAGLTPTVRSSDGKARLGRITKQGSHLLRWALIEAAQKTPTGGGPLREQYERIAKRRGAKVARVAVARQILTLSYYGLRDGEIRRLKPPAPASPMKVSATA